MTSCDVFIDDERPNANTPTNVTFERVAQQFLVREVIRHAARCSSTDCTIPTKHSAADLWSVYVELQ